MKLRKLHIEDYKMFKDFDIDFVDENDEALPIVVLAGLNGSGKTTLLEYIYSPITLNDITPWISQKTQEKNSGIKVVYQNASVIENVKAMSGFLDNNISEEITRRDKKEFKSEDKNITSQFIDKVIKEEYQKNLLYILAGIEDISKVETSFVKYWYNQVKFYNKRNDEIAEDLQKFITKILDGLELNFNYSHIDEDDNIFFKNDKEKFKISNLSTGEKTLVSKVLYLYFQDYKDKVILIDEPELSLHPSWQNKVLKIYENFAKQNNCQIIIATHSPHIIGSAKNEYLRILRKNEKGNIEVINDLKAEGRDINSILFDVMGEVAYRPKEFDEKIDRLYIAIDDRKMEEAKERLEELKKSYGENDEVVMEAQMLIDMFSRDEA